MIVILQKILLKVSSDGTAVPKPINVLVSGAEFVQVISW